MSGTDGNDAATPLVEVEDVEIERKSTNHNSSVQHHDEGFDGVDKFIGEHSVTDSAIRRDMKNSRYSYMAGEHGLTIN